MSVLLPAWDITAWGVGVLIFCFMKVSIQVNNLVAITMTARQLVTRQVFLVKVLTSRCISQECECKFS